MEKGTSLATVLQQAAGLLAQQQNAEAETLLRAALGQWPDQPDLLKYLGSAHEQAGDPVGAEAFYRAALARDPGAFTVATQIGHILRNLRQLPDAITAFQMALAINPNYADAWHGLALALQHSGRLDDALAAFDRALLLAPNHVGILNNRGLLLGDLDRHEEALTSFSRAIGHQPNFIPALMNRGVKLHRLGRYEEALKNHDRVLALDPNNPVALANRGVTLQNLERHDEALASFEKSLAIYPENADVWSNHGNTLHNLKRHDQALASFDRALFLIPGHAQSWNNRGMVLQAMGRLGDALESFDKAVAAKPDYAETWNSRAIVLTDLGRPADALESIARVMALNPGHDGALRNTGLALFESQRIADGLEAFAQLARQTFDAVAKSEDKTAPHRIRHDDEQRAYLKSIGADPSLVNRVLHWSDGARVSGDAINKTDVAAVSEKWRQNNPQIVVIDNFLTDAALAQLRKFCLGSSIWRHSYEDGYLGALPEQGFAAPLLGQIADEMRLAYPGIFKAHALRYLWAFKYDSALSGTAIHADQAAVNVNFWITQDEANLDPNSGGLVVWDKTAPLDWDFERFNCDEKAQRDFLASTGARPVVIPHRANRAVIFDSDLFHETDKIVFKDGYENRRINITLLYGRRGA